MATATLQQAANFDTSGEVYVGGIRYTFDGSAGPGPHLSPFVQGYVRALMDTASDGRRWDHSGYLPAFSDLAPETLARIMVECAAIQSGLLIGTPAEAGREAWALRQIGWPDWGTAPRLRFPPLTVYLGDDGKVRFQ